jgi:transposase
MGPRTTCYNRIVRWRKAGVWDRLMDAITIAHDGDIQMIDSTSVRVHQQAATAHDGQIADTLLDHLVPRTIVLADKAYDADRIRELIQDQGAASLLATTSSPPTSSP